MGTYVDVLGLTVSFSTANNNYFSPMTGSGLKDEYKSIFAQQQLFRYIGKTEVVVDPYAGVDKGTFSITYGGGAMLGLGAEYNRGISIDRNGNYVRHYSYAVPSKDKTAKVGLISAGFSINIMYTNRYLASELKDMSSSIGGSYGVPASFGGALIYLDGGQPDGVQFSIGKGIGADLYIEESKTVPIDEGKIKDGLIQIMDIIKEKLEGILK